MTDQRLDDLEKRCLELEARTAALTAFATAVLESHPQRDAMETRWVNQLGPALHEFLGATAEPQLSMASRVLTWVHGRLLLRGRLP